MQFAELIFVISIGLLCSEINLVQANQLKKYGGNLEALCGGSQTDFRNVGDLRNLIYLLDDPEASKNCPKPLFEALRSFGEIVKDKNACSLKKALDLAQFYEKFLRAREDVGEEEKSASGEPFEKLPKPFIRFVLAYGMRVSSICKKYMINVFLKKANEELTDDFKELAEWTNDKSPISRLLGSLVKPYEIVLPGDLSSVLPNGRTVAKFAFLTASSGKVNRVREICTKRFKPHYLNVLVPLAILANSGFAYTQTLFGIDLMLRSKVVPKIALWSRIVFLCESLDGVEVRQYEQNQLETSPTPVELVPIEEDTNEEAKPVQVQSIDFGFEQIDTVYPEVKIDDEIMGQMDLRLKTLVKMFKQRKTYEQRVRERLLGRGWSLLLARLKYGEFKSFTKGVSELIKATLRRQKDRTQYVDDELSALLDTKDETRLYKVLSSLHRTKKTVCRKFVALLVRFVAFIIIFVLGLTNTAHDFVDNTTKKLREY